MRRYVINGCGSCKGRYAEPCLFGDYVWLAPICTIDMLQDQLNNLLTDTFIGWKSGEYLSTDILVLRFAEMEEIDEI